MTDVLLVLVILAFFALCVLYVLGCERIIRGDQIDAAVADEDVDGEAISQEAVR